MKKADEFIEELERFHFGEMPFHRNDSSSKVAEHCKEKVVLLTISLYMSNWEKSPCSSKPSIFIQKDETVGLPTNDPWDSQLFASQNFTFLKCLQNHYTLQK